MTRRAVVPPVLATVMLVGVALLASSCSCSPASSTSVTSSGGAGGAPTSTSSTTGSVSASSSSNSSSAVSGGASSTSSSGGGPAGPCPGWNGWEAWDDFAAGAPFCVPSSTAALPEPIQWEPCDPLSGMATGCQQMKITWPYKAKSSPLAVTISADVRLDGHVVLDFIRNSLVAPNGWRMLIIADADGPALSAMLDPRSAPTGWLFQNAYFEQGVNQGRTVNQIYDSSLDEGFQEAIFGGAQGELHPKVQRVWPSSGGHAFATSDTYWGTHDALEINIAPWGGTLQKVYDSAQAGGLQQTMLHFHGSFAMWQSGDLNTSNLMAWTPGSGAYFFITFGGDPSQGAHGLGTDGKQMVWVQSKGKLPGAQDYMVRDVMVSPHTEDPVQLQPKRLRAYPSKYPVIASWVVGCGYAAYNLEPGKTMIVRLSDGVAWYPPSTGCTPPNVSNDWCWDQPYAITCDELFLRGGVGLSTNIARVKLDALGPGIPPD